MPDFNISGNVAAPKAKQDEQSITREALECYQRWYENERENVAAAYEDLEFRAGNQWPTQVLAERTGERRPIQTVNRIPQFVRQVTGDMRQMRPSIKVVPVDSAADKETADVLAGMLRYVENRSDATAIYTAAADSQVTAGIGHWQVISEYADDTTFAQELRIIGVDDSIAVAWDVDSKLPTREDAMWCIVPVDISRTAFKVKFPKANIEDFDVLPSEIRNISVDWFTKDMVRIAQYWKKVPTKKKLAMQPDGGIVDLTDDDRSDDEFPEGTRIEERDGFKVVRYLITAAHILEKSDWIGRNIPVIPALGEEVRIGRRTVRHGIVRFAKDSQRAYNYFQSAHTEVVGLQPKAPFIGTERNFERYAEEWRTANTKNWPFLQYTPDPQNGNIPPTRVQPPLASQGIIQGIQLAAEDMKAVIGIYDASLGAKSNETSGRAILARQREGDVGTFVYIDNFNRAVRRTGVILLDLIPHIYDTERQIRIVGEDGHVQLAWINKAVGIDQQGVDGELSGARKLNDVTVGAYDVVMQNGPSYTTKAAEARDGMTQFIQAAPEVAPAVIDLVAKAQDWPMAAEFADRLKAIAPPPVQALIKKQEQKDGPPPPPTQDEIMQMQRAQMQEQLQMQAVQLELENKKLTNDKIRADIVAEVNAAQAAQAPETINALEQGRQILDAQMAAGKDQRDVEAHQLDMVAKQLDLEKKRTEIMALRGKMAIDARTHGLEMAQGMRGDEVPESGAGPTDEELLRYCDPAAAIMQEISPLLANMAQSFQQGQVAMAQALQALAQSIDSPKVVVRDKGQIVGVQSARTLN